MKRAEVQKALFNRYIKPTLEEQSKYIGIEVEMPIVNLEGKATNQELAQRVFEKFVENYGFVRDQFDDNGVCFSATLEENGDNISFDCSYNNLELSLGREKDLHEVQKRFRKYVEYLNTELKKENHLLTGFGINPYKDRNIISYIPSERYRMLEHYLGNYKKWDDVPMYFHPYPAYGTFASASQVQLDVKEENLLEVIKAFSLVEPVKAVLFSNSVMPTEPELLCVRDMLWENSTHGINPHNVGMFEKFPETTEELIDYISSTSIFNVERDGKYIHFKPIPIEEYFDLEKIEGEYYENGDFHTVFFEPEKNDIRFLRTYKFEDLTFRGTIEFRSCCNQPFSEAMTVAAFHVGLIRKFPQLIDLLENDNILYNHGLTATELRKLMNRVEWPTWVDREGLKDLIRKVLDLAREGLMERGKGEEEFLEPLYKRADTLTSPGRIINQKLTENSDLTHFIKVFSKFKEEDD